MFRADNILNSIITTDNATPSNLLTFDTSLEDQLSFPVDNLQKWNIEINAVTEYEDGYVFEALSHRYEFSLAYSDSDGFAHFIDATPTPVYEKYEGDAVDYTVAISIDANNLLVDVNQDVEMKNVYWYITGKVWEFSSEPDYIPNDEEPLPIVDIPATYPLEGGE